MEQQKSDYQGGRPTKSDAQKKKRRYIYLSDKQYEKVIEKAKDRGLSFSEFARLQMIGKKAVNLPQANPELIRLKGELNKVGSNLNQGIKLAHKDGFGEAENTIKKVVGNGVIPILKELKKELNIDTNDTEG